MKNSIKKQYVLLLLTLLGILQAKAQEALNSWVTYPTGVTLTVEQSGRLSKISDLGLFESIQLITFKNLSTTQQGGKLLIVLPSGSACDSLIFTAQSVSYEGEEEFKWYGLVKNEDCECGEGNILLMATNGKRFGQLWIGGIVYKIYDLGGGLGAIATVESERVNKEYLCPLDSSETVMNDSLRVERTEGQVCLIRVLVFYTKAAEEAVSDINQTIDLAFEQAKIALQNSNVSTCDLTLQLVGKEELWGFVETGIAGDDLNIFSTDPLVLQWREPQYYAADLVILMTDGNYDFNNLLGRVLEIGPSQNEAFGIVEADAIEEGHHTFAHEIAHLMGARHNDDPTNPPAKAKVFYTDCLKMRRTVVANGSKIISNILHYSNPDVYYHNHSTGANNRNNTQIIIDNACTVGSFVADPPPTANDFFVQLVGPNFDCPCASTSLQTQLSLPCQPNVTYLYEYYVSSDGINYAGPYAGGSSYLTFLPCDEGEAVFIKVKVTASTGVVRWGMKCIVAESHPPGGGPCAARYAAISQDTEVFELYPNPTNQNFTMKFYNAAPNSQYKLTITDMQGRKMESKIFHVAVEGIHEFLIDTESFVSGYYSVQIEGVGYKNVKTIGIFPTH